MIDPPVGTLKILGERIALANNASFLWRKLAESPTVQNLAATESEELLEADLKELLAEEQLTENQQTRAYVILMALLLKSPVHARSLGTVEGIDRLYWARRLLARAERSFATTGAQLFQPPVIARPVSATTSRVREQLIIIPGADE